MAYTILRAVAHIGCFLFGGTFLVALLWEMLTQGGVMLDARAQPELADAGSVALLLIWAACSVVAAIARDAGEPSR